MDRKVIEIGNRAIVSDPCYERDYSGRLAKVLNTEPGLWNVEVEYSDEGAWGKRVGALVAWHSSHGTPYGMNDQLRGCVGVDSGQMCICDHDFYPSGETTGEYGEMDTFYGKACAATYQEGVENHPNFGTVGDRCAVSSSGFGDGCYPVFIQTKHGNVVGIRVEFIGDEAEEEEEEYEEEDDEN